MSVCDPMTEFQRFRFWQGQLLRSRDFRDQLAIEAQLRWWHNRALHNAYGVAGGFEVSSGTEPNTLTVAPGIAYDIFGRELILQKEKNNIPIPDEESLLLIRYKETSEYPEKRWNMGLSDIENNPGLPTAEPVFEWKRAQAVDARQGVPIWRTKDPEGFIPPFARALARPHIAGGSTVPGHTAWRPWKESAVTLGAEVRIDTSAAGFIVAETLTEEPAGQHSDNPCYFAWVQEQATQQSVLPVSVSDQTCTPVFFTHLYEPSVTGFGFRVWVPNLANLEALGCDSTVAPDIRFITYARQSQLVVCWLGVQMVAVHEL